MQRVTVNPKNGRTERVHVNLEALYPGGDASGTELSFEELIAGHRGWLKKVWKQETSLRSDNPQKVEDKMDKSAFSADALSGEMLDSQTSHNPVILDENGMAKDLCREGKARKMKIKEINETQISESEQSVINLL
jgi:checkpoint serine/threonine-protein kinase